MRANFHINDRTGKKVYGAANTAHQIRIQGEIDNYDENRREEGRSEVFKSLQGYFNQLERVEQKLDFVMNENGLKFSPKLRNLK